MNKRTKIVCTIGPASSSVEILKKMIKAGMNVARLNFSHGSYESHASLIKNIRQAAKETGVVISLLQDLQGPRIRLSALPKEGIMIKKGDKVTFTTAKSPSKGKIGVTYGRLHNEIKAGHRILIADGVFEYLVKQVKGQDIITTAVTDAKLTSNKGMNFPDTSLKISSVSAKDISDLDFGISQQVDFVALSFVRTVADVVGLRRRIDRLEKKHKIKKSVEPKIIVKVEMPDAIRNFDDILEVSDGVMVARGDLGIEMPAEDVPILQKEMIKKCNAAAKPVIVATQMLESMIVNPRPTRAEVSDVANAVIDHTDAVMLSGESALGKFPVEAVTIMAKTLVKIEQSHYDDFTFNGAIGLPFNTSEAVAMASVNLADDIEASMMIVLSMSGQTGRYVSKYRPELPILVTTASGRVARQMNLSWGVIPVDTQKVLPDEQLIKAALKFGAKNKLAKLGSEVVLIKGHAQAEKRHHASSIEIITL